MLILRIQENRGRGKYIRQIFENTEVIAKGDLQCNYILNCRVLTYGRIFVEGPIGSIIGGDVTGVMGISTTSCGHESNVKTLLRVGSTKEIRKEYAELIMELKEVDGQIETFEMANKKFEMIKQNMPESMIVNGIESYPVKDCKDGSESQA